MAANHHQNVLTKWVYMLVGPVLAIVAFVGAYFIDPLQFGGPGPTAAIPAFLLSIVILLIGQNISTHKEIEKTSIYSDRIYDAIKDYMHVIPVGSPEKAIQYIISRLPALREAKNTSFNIEFEIERADEKFYDTDQYINSLNQIATYSTKKLIWKDLGDKFALKRFRSIDSIAYNISKNKKYNYKYRLMAHTEPQLNFIILEYGDGSREVLFNWDFRGLGQDPTVLISRDRQIIEMFAIHYELLWRRASPDHDNTAVKSISEK